MVQELKNSPKGNTYWNEKAEYYDFLMQKFKELVPDHGEADTVHGELVRAFHRLTYEYYNNGNCNAQTHEFIAEDCWECSGTGEIDAGWDDETEEELREECPSCDGLGEDLEAIDKYGIDEYYDDMLMFIENHVYGTSQMCDDIREHIQNPGKAREFGDDNEHKYTVLGDKIAHYVLTTENKKREKQLE